MLRTIRLMGAIGVLSACSLVIPQALASNTARYSVTVTNLTQGQTLTPLLLVTHRNRVRLFELGRAASAELVALAEEGDVGPLEALLANESAVSHVINAVNVLGPPPASLLGPGESVTHEIRGFHQGGKLSLAAMFIPTNDAFAAIDSVRLPRAGREVSYVGFAYDAGSEVNDQLCTSIPGPFCPPNSPGMGADENGVVHVHAGIHEVGDLDPAEYDWRNPVIRVHIERVR